MSRYYKEWAKKYYQKNITERRKRAIDYYHKNRDEINTKKRLKRRLNPVFREREKKYNYRYRKENQSYKEYRQAIKLEVINHYGGKCNCCGELNMKFLTIDHINNDGKQFRQKNGKGRLKGFPLYVFLKTNNFPTNVQVLCFNCNIAKQIYGVCPHQDPSIPPHLAPNPQI